MERTTKVEQWRNDLLNEIATLEQELELVNTRRKLLMDRREKLKRKLRDGATGELRGLDSLLVMMGDIRTPIKQWIDLYDRQHGNGGQLMLSERSTVSTRLIRSVVNGSNNGKRFVTLQTADRLLQACNLSHIISDLEVYETGAVRAKAPDPPYSHFEED